MGERARDERWNHRVTRAVVTKQPAQPGKGGGHADHLTSYFWLLLEFNPARISPSHPSPGHALSELSLEGCSITCRGAVALASALRAPSCRLRTLVLDDNNVADDGARALAAAVASSIPLRELLLSQNPHLTAQSASALVTAATRRDGADRLALLTLPRRLCGDVQPAAKFVSFTV